MIFKAITQNPFLNSELPHLTNSLLKSHKHVKHNIWEMKLVILISFCVFLYLSTLSKALLKQFINLHYKSN